MLKEPTLFVVGAGASFSLGFPTGVGLVSSISQKLNFSIDAFGKVQGDQRLWHAIELACKETNGKIQEYFKTSREISSGIGLTDSIDRYVDAHSHDPVFSCIAKLAIAFFILDAESHANDNYYSKVQELKFLNIPPNYWLASFCKLHFANFKRSNLASIFENVAFVSFNYDRCIQNNLAIGLAKHFRLPDVEAIQLVQLAKIIHPYGSLGQVFGGNHSHPFPFGSKLSSTTVLAASKGINTFTEGPSGADFKTNMSDLMNWCKNIIFVGFGFASPNLELLGAPDKAKMPKKVLGTAFNMKRPNIDFLNQKLPQLFHSPNAVPLREDLKAEELLEEYSLSLFS